MMQQEGLSHFLALRACSRTCQLANGSLRHCQWRYLSSSSVKQTFRALSPLPGFVKLQLRLDSPVDVMKTSLLYPAGNKDLGRIISQQTSPVLNANPSLLGKLASVIDAQLRAVKTPQEFIRVIAVALKYSEGKEVIKDIRWQDYPILASTCINSVHWLAIWNTLATRLERAGLELRKDIIWLGLIYAAQSYNPYGMKHWLKALKSRGLDLQPEEITELIQALDAGRRARPQLRKTVAEAMRQVIMGFDGADPCGPMHLTSFRSGSIWEMRKLRARVLSDCGDVPGVWAIWQERWNALEKLPEASRIARDDIIIAALLEAGGYKEAWLAVKESKLRAADLSEKVLSKLLDRIEFAEIWDENFQMALESKFTTLISNLEKALNLEWRKSENGGFHVFKDPAIGLFHLSGATNSIKVLEANRNLDFPLIPESELEDYLFHHGQSQFERVIS